MGTKLCCEAAALDNNSIAQDDSQNPNRPRLSSGKTKRNLIKLDGLNSVAIAVAKKSDEV